jgi:hypothetical protein
VETEVPQRPGDAESGSAGLGDSPTPTPTPARPRPAWWLLTALAVGLSLVIGATVEHVIDRRAAARTLYQMQVNTTLSRFFDQEQAQLSRPVPRRSAAAFGNLADAITADTGVNGSGTLQVTLGAGSTAQPTQIAFAATVDSPYASTTVAVWYVRSRSGDASNQGACVLSSTLLGPGRATTQLNLSASEFLAPCPSRFWSAGSAASMQPRLGLAGIPRSPKGS